MMISQNAIRSLSLGLLLLTLGGCASERLYRQGMTEIENGRFESGLELLKQASSTDRTDLQYRTAYQRQRENIVNAFVETADKGRREGKFADAEALLRRAAGIDPASTRIELVSRAVERDRSLTEQMRDAERLAKSGKIEEAGEALKKISLRNPDLKGLAEARLRLDSLRMAQRTSVPLLKSRQARPVNLQFRNTGLRIVLEALSRDTGINFILDKDVRADTNVTVFVQQVRVEEAVDLILIPAQLEKKIISENTVLVYPATAAKQKEYQDLLLRSFYIQNADIKQTMTMLKTMLKLKDVFVDERVNLLVIRDTPDVVRMAERLIAAHDVPEPEVMLEVEVLEITRTAETSIGARYPDSLTIRDGNLVDKFNNIIINLKSSEGRANLLSNPRIRVKSRQKARTLIGERVPVISSTTAPTINGTTVALVSQQIQYLDIGLKLEVEPIVNMDDSVSIKLGLEVNALGEKTETQTGAVAYRVGTRTTNTTLELKDGETQVLAGLIQDEDRRSANRIPIIGEFPLLDRLFGTVATGNTKTEIVLSITPRILRSVRRADAFDQESWSGTETVFRERPLMLIPAGVADGRPLPGGQAPSAGTPAQTPSASLSPATSAAASAAANPLPAGAAEPPVQVTWLGAKSARIGQEMTVALSLRASAAVSSTAFQLQFDPAAVEILAVEEGGLLRQDSQATTFNHTIDPAGRIFGGVARASGAGITGTGALATIRLRARPGAKAISLTPTTISPIGRDGRVIPLTGIPAFEASVAP